TDVSTSSLTSHLLLSSHSLFFPSPSQVTRVGVVAETSCVVEVGGQELRSTTKLRVRPRTSSSYLSSYFSAAALSLPCISAYLSVYLSFISPVSQLYSPPCISALSLPEYLSFIFPYDQSSHHPTHDPQRPPTAAVGRLTWSRTGINSRRRDSRKRQRGGILPSQASSENNHTNHKHTIHNHTNHNHSIHNHTNHNHSIHNHTNRTHSILNHTNNHHKDTTPSEQKRVSIYKKKLVFHSLPDSRRNTTDEELIPSTIKELSSCQ
ncbi:hypothetical protein Hamer_G002891, partial [Homarus americanus]